MTTNDNFIGYYQIQDLSICDDVVEFWKNSLNKKVGESYSPTRGSLVDINWKDSLDVNIDPNYNSPVFKKYIEELRKSIEVYKETFPFSTYYSSWKIVDGANIQYYKPGAGFKAWHCERGSAIMPVTTRHLAWMTYLNDVDDGGGTEFFHQKLTIQAKKGLTVIWPADWTYTHRGVVSPTQEKYIITGWFNYFVE